MTSARNWIRSRARSALLTAVGSRADLSPSIHILAGHDLGDPAGHDPARFRALLEMLSSKAELIRVEDAVEAVKERRHVDHPMIAFTFDDGYIECHRHLAPALRDAGVNAAFFVNSRYIDATPDYIERFNQVVRSPGRLPMTSDMVRELADEGFVIGSHTADHSKLDRPDHDLLTDQIVTARAEVESISGRPAPWFAWPYGRYIDVCDEAMTVALDTYDTVFSGARYETYTAHGGRVLNRRHFEAYWPSSHVRYFLRNPRAWEG